MTSPRLCGGMFVAMPTAMPPAPLTSRLGNFAGRTDGSELRAVVVLAEVDRVLVEIVQQVLRDLGQPAFGVAHRRRAIAVDRAEVALAVDQRHAQRPVLGHAHQGVVDGEVAVRVVLAHHLADDTRALDVLPVPVDAEFAHAEQDAPVHGLEAVADVGQRARHDHAHGVIEIAALHLVRDGHGTDVAAAPACGGAAGGVSSLAKRGSPYSALRRASSAGRTFVAPRSASACSFNPQLICFFGLIGFGRASTRANPVGTIA